jgi:phosphoglycolate phosphatase-like HAD superfamily hydrolase
MNLVMFDIDGTLTATTGVDAQCFVRAVNDLFHIKDVDTDLTTYKNVTDEGIAEEIIERHTGRVATKKELSDLKKLFVEMLRKKVSSNPALFYPVEGAVEILEELVHHPDMEISLATGGWRESALLKLEAAGLDTKSLPMTSSNDALSREAIMKLSEESAKRAYNVHSFDSVVYVGDGIWDVQSARSVGYHFIGIGIDDGASRLRDEGAIHIIPDFTDRRKFFNILETLCHAQHPGGTNTKR